MSKNNKISHSVQHMDEARRVAATLVYCRVPFAVSYADNSATFHVDVSEGTRLQGMIEAVKVCQNPALSCGDLPQRAARKSQELAELRG